MGLLRDLVAYAADGAADGLRDGLRGALAQHTPVIYLEDPDLVDFANARELGRRAVHKFGWPGFQHYCWCTTVPEITEDQVDVMPKGSRIDTLLFDDLVSETFVTTQATRESVKKAFTEVMDWHRYDEGASTDNDCDDDPDDWEPEPTPFVMRLVRIVAGLTGIVAAEVADHALERDVMGCSRTACSS
jgi:hypothetical protein